MPNIKKGWVEEKISYWLTRDKKDKSDYVLWYGKPDFDGRFFHVVKLHGIYFGSFSPITFEQMTSISFKPGEIHKVKLIEIKLEILCV